MGNEKIARPFKSADNHTSLLIELGSGESHEL